MPGRDLVARARHRHGRRRPRAAGRVAEVGRARPAAHRPRRPRRRRRRRGPHLPQVPRRPARVRGRRAAHARGRDRADRRAAQRARRARPADRRDRRARRAGARSASTTCYALVTRTHSYAELPRELLENVLDMLDGRYPSEEFGELRPRIVWDRVAGTIRARKGARQLAITNAGTIPDRGLYAVTLPDGRRVGELDEEMVYEARPGQTFLLGASTWRIEEIGRDRVIVTPAPGVPGRRPVLEGRRRRAAEGARRGDRRLRALGRRPAAGDARARLRPRPAAPPATCSTSCASSRPRRAWCRRDRTIVVERFRDEIGDWRLCVLSPVRRPRPRRLGRLRCRRAIRDELGLESDAIWSDDGIIVHLPDADEPPGRRARAARARRGRGPGRRRARRSSALFGARFRENAGRALLIPRAYPGRRTPLWQQRLKSQSLLEVAKRYARLPDHPRDLPRVPARRARRARPRGAAARPAPPRALAGRGRDADRVAVRLLAALRLRRDVHVRGRHAERGAPRRRAVARPRPAARAARPGGAARADRPGRARAGRGRPPAPLGAHARRDVATRCTTSCAGSAT